MILVLLCCGVTDNVVVTVSTKSLPWQDAADSWQELLNLEYISKHGWDSLHGVNISEKSLWIAARAKYSPLVSWEGCARWNSNCVSGILSAGSLADCLKNCKGGFKYMLLKGDKCRCFDKNETCIQRITEPCDEQCRNNPNDWCGGGFGAEALYSTGSFGNVSYTAKEMSANINCISAWYNGKFYEDIRVENCETTNIYRSFCKNTSESFESDDLVERNWYEALEFCKHSNADLFYDLPKKPLNLDGLRFWTSLRRGFSINWTNRTDTEYIFCVSARLNRQLKLKLYAEDCNTQRQYLFFTGLQISVSSTSLPWEYATDSGHELLNLDYIAKHGWDSFSGVSFGEKGLWIAARAKYAPLVSWEGCARWNLSCVSDHISAGSIGDCLKNCQGDSKYMLLKDDMCRCFEKSENCIQRTTDSCDNRCRNNPNDWCGGNFGTGTLYLTGPFDNFTDIAKEKKVKESINCFGLTIDNSFNKILHGLDCESTIFRQSICKNNSEAFISHALAQVNWFEALDVCKKSNAHPYFELPTNNSKGIISWTSLRRGIAIQWTNKTDSDYPLCALVRLNKQSKMMLYAEDCNAENQYLFLTYLQRTNVTQTSIVLWPLGLLAILPIEAIIVFLFLPRRNRNNNVTSNRGLAGDHYNVIYPDESGNIEAYALENMSAINNLRKQEDGYDLTRLPTRQNNANYDSIKGCAAFPGKAGYDIVRNASTSKGIVTDPMHVYGLDVEPNS